MGFEPVTGFEYEFYLLDAGTREPLFSGYHIFNTVRNAYVPTVGRILTKTVSAGSTKVRARVRCSGEVDQTGPGTRRVAQPRETPIRREHGLR